MFNKKRIRAGLPLFLLYMVFEFGPRFFSENMTDSMLSAARMIRSILHLLIIVNVARAIWNDEKSTEESNLLVHKQWFRLLIVMAGICFLLASFILVFVGLGGWYLPWMELIAALLLWFLFFTVPE